MTRRQKLKQLFVVRAFRKLGRVLRRQWMHLANRKHYREFDELLRNEIFSFPRIIVMESMPWDHKTKQRPHHLAHCFRDLGTAIIYINRGFHLPKKDSHGIFVVDDQMYFRDYVKEFPGPKYFWLMSPTPVPNKVVREFLSYGLGLIYDHIDEFHETITGEVYAQLGNYADLPSLSPVLLIASADVLYGHLNERFPEGPPLLLMKNAVDMVVFDLSRREYGDQIPSDLAGILQTGKPIVGYYGMVAPWLDYRLLNELTLQRSDIEFVIIGPDYMKGMAKLKVRPNVHVLGVKRYQELPNYSVHFDCAIIPFQRGEIAKSTSPVKLFEYMAMGLPTVCTADLKECEGYDYVFVSADEEEFAANIEKAIELRQDPTVVSRLVEQARDNTWQARANAICNELIRIEEEPG